MDTKKESSTPETKKEPLVTVKIPRNVQSWTILAQMLTLRGETYYWMEIKEQPDSKPVYHWVRQNMETTPSPFLDAVLKDWHQRREVIYIQPPSSDPALLSLLPNKTVTDQSLGSCGSAASFAPSFGGRLLDLNNHQQPCEINLNYMQTHAWPTLPMNFSNKQ